MRRRVGAMVALVIGLTSSRLEAGMSMMGVSYEGLNVAQQAAAPRTYVVKAGDTLWGIAEKFFGNGQVWTALFGANRDKIENPDLIYPGELIRLPGTPGGPPARSEPPTAQPPTVQPPTVEPRTASAGPGDSGALAAWKGGKLSPAEFSRLLGPAARESQIKTGVPASVTLAQAALETGWGSSSIGDGKNLFGMKGTGPAGTSNVRTQEFQNGHYVTITDGFRKYHSWSESIADHADLLSTGSRYRRAMQVKNDPNQFAQEIHKAGYATDPSYASKLIEIMKANNFYQWDVKETAMRYPVLSVILFALAALPCGAEELEIIASAAWAPATGAYGTVQKVHDATGVYVRVVDTLGAPLWRSPSLGARDHQFSVNGRPTELAVMDLTGDGKPEIVTAAFHGPDAAGLYVFEGAPSPGFKLLRCEHPEVGLSRPFLVSDRPAPGGLDFACQPGGTVRVRGRSFPDDLSGPPVDATYVYRYGAGAFRLTSVEKL